MQVTVVGIPGSRRVALFTAALRRAGLPAPILIPWSTLLSQSLPTPVEGRVRIESPGEDAETDRLLRGAATPLAHGEIGGSKAWFQGFSAALEKIGMPGEVAGIRVMFDKAVCHARLSAAGIPVPPALPRSPAGWADLREKCAWDRVFVKPRHGSSASGVIALEFGARGRVQATTSVELAPDGRLFNSLRIRRYRDEREIAAIVDRLAPDGLHVERWFPKAGLGGRVLDLRVVLVGGRVTHAVGRASRSPMTNLHLGGARIDATTIRAAAGAKAWAEAMHSCGRVAALFPQALRMGVDLMFRAGWRDHAIAEVNAFGDLLPGLLDAQGRDTYDVQVEAMLA